MRKKGRPSSPASLAARFTAAQVMETLDTKARWMRFLDSEDEKVSFDAWKLLNERVYGKAAQSMKIEGDLGIEVAVKRVVADL